MLLVEILRNIDIFTTINFKFYFFPGIFLFPCNYFCTEMYIKKYINFSCTERTSITYKELYKSLLLKESAMSYCLLET